jgi:hypothetical protein
MHRWTRWLTVAATTGALPTCVAFIVWSPSRILSTAAAVTFVVCVGHLVYRSDHRDSTTVAGIVKSTATMSICLTTTVVALRLVADVSAALALLVVLALAVTSPPVRRVLERGTHRLSRQQRESTGARTGLEHLTDGELCAAWRRTTQDLSTSRDSARRLSVVITRQHLLDELWRRDRAALDSWVARGARAKDGTSRYFDPQ